MPQELPLLQAQAMAARTPFRAALSILVPEARAQTEADLRAQVAAQGRQFTKLEALYFGITPILPVAWFYACADCVFFNSEARTCAIVEGNIEPQAWCPLWVQNEGDKPFSWFARAFA